jgi:hypothetical protein
LRAQLVFTSCERNPSGSGGILIELTDLRPLPGSSWYDSRELSVLMACEPTAMQGESRWEGGDDMHEL